MAVVGIGVDAIEISRVRAALERTPGLLARLFTERERATCLTRCGDLRYGGLAGRFAAKEAVAKALGTGISGFGFRDIEVLGDERGKPTVTLHGGAARVAAAAGVETLHVSLSTSAELAVANAVAESAPTTMRR
ncbi:MAG: holo-ACP synthase [Nitriliruptorales bacterium]|nr:holo-ACP synthase [Nitriliruptorales bacterium]